MTQITINHLSDDDTFNCNEEVYRLVYRLVDAVSAAIEPPMYIKAFTPTLTDRYLAENNQCRLITRIQDIEYTQYVSYELLDGVHMDLAVATLLSQIQKQYREATPPPSTIAPSVPAA